MVRYALYFFPFLKHPLLKLLKKTQVPGVGLTLHFFFLFKCNRKKQIKNLDEIETKNQDVKREQKDARLCPIPK